MQISRYRLLAYLVQLLEVDESLSRLGANAPDLSASEKAHAAVRAELVRVLKEVPEALQDSADKASRGRGITRFERWFLLFRPRSVAAWCLHFLFYSLCIYNVCLGLVLGYWAFMGNLAEVWGEPMTKFGAPLDVPLMLSVMVGLTIAVSLIAQRLDQSRARAGQPTTVQKVFLWFWPPSFVSAFAQSVFYLLFFGLTLSLVLPPPWPHLPLGRAKSAVLDLRTALTMLACYLLALSQWRPLAQNSRILSSARGLLLLDPPRGVFSWCATSSLALQLVLSPMIVLWFISGRLPLEALLVIPLILLVTYVWALEERRRPRATT